ncbi:unnamed protein product [Closterium sp. Yama58-4]|nr:unnamed protein product [Closterium sp. Yama58-4]
MLIKYKRRNHKALVFAACHARLNLHKFEATQCAYSDASCVVLVHPSRGARVQDSDRQSGRSGPSDAYTASGRDDDDQMDDFDRDSAGAREPFTLPLAHGRFPLSFSLSRATPPPHFAFTCRDLCSLCPLYRSPICCVEVKMERRHGVGSVLYDRPSEVAVGSYSFPHPRSPFRRDPSPFRRNPMAGREAEEAEVDPMLFDNGSEGGEGDGVAGRAGEEEEEEEGEDLLRDDFLE